MADNNKKVSRVVFNNETLIDLTTDTVTEDKLLKGATAHRRDGVVIEGACTYDSDTSDATARASEILAGEVAYANGNRIVGEMPNNEYVYGTITDKTKPYKIARGYHPGDGEVYIDPSSRDALVANNIRDGVKILGVTGTMSGEEGVKAQDKQVTPSLDHEVYVVPDYTAGYTHLSSVLVYQVPCTRTANDQGGITVTIG